MIKAATSCTSLRSNKPYSQLELCRAHTLRAYCAIYRFTFGASLARQTISVHGYNFVNLREIMENYAAYAPINVMPHLPQVGLGWGHIGVLHQLISKVLTLGATLRFKVPYCRKGINRGLCRMMLICAEVTDTVPKDMVQIPNPRDKS